MFSAVTGALALAIAALPLVSSAATPLAPSTDPFYIPPTGYKLAAPGAILHSRAINTSFLAANSGVTAYQLLYRTTAANGSAIATVTTIFKPSNAALDRFVSFHTAYDSSALQCDPSYTYQQGANQTNAITTAEQSFLQDYLNNGYIVAAPDYEGPDAAFGAGRLEGMGVLDGMRAVINYRKTLGLTSSTPSIVGYGYSGGAIATGWAASLHPQYARELNIKGWALGGTPANLTGTLLFLDGSLFSGFVPDAVNGLLKPSAYLKQLQPLLYSIATPKGLAYLDYASSHCAIDDVTNFSGMSLLSTQFQSLGPALIYNPTVVSVLQANLMGFRKSETPIAPVYMYHASGDEIIPYANASTLANTWCTNGASVQFVTLLIGGHATGEANGFSGAETFVASAFAGTVGSGCSRSSLLFRRDSELSAGLSEPVTRDVPIAVEIAAPEDASAKRDPSSVQVPATH